MTYDPNAAPGGLPSVEDLWQMAMDDNMLSQSAMSSLSRLNRMDLTRLNGVLGAPAAGQGVRDVLLVLFEVDDSSSIARKRLVTNPVTGDDELVDNKQAVRDAKNEILHALIDSKQAQTILVYTDLMNAGAINHFVPIEEALELDENNYNPSGNTPLHDKTAEIVGLAIAKAADFTSNNGSVRVLIFVITDGANWGSVTYTKASQVKPIVDDAVNSEDPVFMIIGWGISDGTTDFTDEFNEMGIMTVMTSANDPHDIRATAKVASRSAAKFSNSANPKKMASQAAKNGLGGFMG